MRVLFLPKYGRRAASARYRFYQYEPYLRAAGISPTFEPLLPDEYLRRKFETGRAPIGLAASALRDRLLTMLRARRFDLVVIHCEAFPFMPPWLERLLSILGVPYAYDFDDAIFHGYDQSPSAAVRILLSSKVASIIARAHLVLAGSPYLAAYARQWTSNVVDMPTVVDLDAYQPGPKPKDEKEFTIGWIGSPSTAQYLLPVAPGIRLACERTGARVVLVGSGPIDLPGVPAEVRPWAEAMEVDAVKHFSVGIMPLTDTPWARGKCAFKLIQYMACARPVIASPVGMNVDLVASAGAGMLAESTEEWADAIVALWGDPDRRDEMGRAGRREVEERYCVQRTAPRLVEALRALAAKRGSWSPGVAGQPLQR